MTETATRIAKVIKELGLSMAAEFVPWSKSKRKDEKEPSLNWRVTLSGRVWREVAGWKGDSNIEPILTTDCGAGCGHCPGYKQRETYESKKVVRWECEHGKPGWFMPSLDMVCGRSGRLSQPLQPKLEDVLHCLLLDAEALDYATFEDWASSLGYDADSRKAETIYRSCLATGLKLKNALGYKGLQKLKRAFEDY